MLQRLPIALAQVKAGSRSDDLLNKIRQIIYTSFLFQQTRFSRQAEIFLVFLPYEPGMFLKCFLINQIQIIIPMIPTFLCSCAKKKKKKTKKTCRPLRPLRF